MDKIEFYLGTHRYIWLKDTYISPLFISNNILKKLKKLPTAKCQWALDSGGFTEIAKYGKWTRTPKQYCEDINRYREKIGNVLWAAPQDWMCEPFMLKKTGLTVLQHQQNTVQNYIDLMSIDDTLPIIPVLQGYTISDYIDCMLLYNHYGIKVINYDRVGIGSVCRRQNTQEIKDIIKTLHTLGFNNLHGFGVKKQGLINYGKYLKSADSMAWSYNGRQVKCPYGKLNCANCWHYALDWTIDIKCKLL